jgi:hypothetical protein
MKITRFPDWIILADYGQARLQQSPGTRGRVYKGLGRPYRERNGQRGLMFGTKFFLVHVTIPEAEDDAYPFRHPEGKEPHAKHFHITLADPVTGSSQYHFHYLTDWDNRGVPRAQRSIQFRADPAQTHLQTGNSD